MPNLQVDWRVRNLSQENAEVILRNEPCSIVKAKQKDTNTKSWSQITHEQDVQTKSEFSPN